MKTYTIFHSYSCRIRLFFLVAIFYFIAAASAFSLPKSRLFADVNHDRQFSILAFGDSITRGSGDTVLKGGYPTRLQNILGVSVVNDGVGGDALAINGLARLKRHLLVSNADLVILNDGNSDAGILSLPIRSFRQALGNAVAYVKRRKKNIVLATQYPVLYQNATVQPRIAAINTVIHQVAQANSIALVDVDRAWRSTCNKIPNCNLLYTDHVHPNSKGYDVITDTTLATLDFIHIFIKGGAARVEKAYGLPTGSVKVKPD